MALLKTLLVLFAVMVRAQVLTVLDVVATFTEDAPELESTISPDFVPAVAVAANRK